MTEPTVSDIAPILVRQETMAKLLSVSVRWLRDSGCPVVTLPSSRPKGRRLLRYDVEQARAWYRTFATDRAAA